MHPSSTLTKYPSHRAVGSRKLLVLAPRKLFSSIERRSELRHFLSLCSAWKKLASEGRSSLDFTVLSTKHALEEMPGGLHSLRRSAFLSELTGFEVDAARVGLRGVDAARVGLRGVDAARVGLRGVDVAGVGLRGVDVAGVGLRGVEGAVEVNFVESSGLAKEELSGFLEQNAADFSIPVAGWHHWPTTRSLVSDSYALSSAGSSLLENGKYAGVLAVGWPVFDAALRLSKDHSLPAFCKFSTPSRLEAEAEGRTPVEAVVARELAAMRHAQAILSFDTAMLGWILKNYSPKALAAEKMSDFENVLEVLELLSDSAGLMQIVSAGHAHPHDRRAAISLLKEARSTLDSHSVSHGEHFVASKYCAAFNSPVEIKTSSKSEISSAKRVLHSLSSLEGAEISGSKPKKVFSLVVTDASEEVLKCFSKALCLMPDSAFVVRSDSPKLAEKLNKISGDARVSHRIALLPEKEGGKHAALLAASHAIVFPNPVASLLHYEDALSAVHSARQAGATPPAIIASRAAPFLLRNSATLPSPPSGEKLQSALSSASAGTDFSRQPATQLSPWSWNDAALKLVEFLSARL